MARPGSIIGDRQYHLSVPYLRSKRVGAALSRPTAQQLRAGRALGHPRSGGRDDEPSTSADPGTQTDALFDEEKN
jgi:hypothetical protein